MAETTENILMTAPKLVQKLHKANSRRAKINNLSSLKTVDTINNMLTTKQKIMFQHTCFGHFLSMGTFRLQFSAQLVHQLLLREVGSPNTNEMWFLVGEKAIRFSMQEFCVVTGLSCGPCPRVDAHKKVQGVRLRDEIFNGNMNLCVNDVEAAFMKGSDNDEYMVKLALFYFLETVLLGRDKRRPINNEHILLVDDLQQFQNYAWGKVCFEMTMKSLKEALRDAKSTEEFVTYTLIGFPQAFQVWAFEAMPSVIQDAKFAIKYGYELPRINNWWSTATPNFKTVQELLGQKNLQVHTVLKLSYKEKQQEYLREFISPPSYELSPPAHICKLKCEIEEPEVATDIMAKKRKLLVEAALVEEPCLAPKKCTAKDLDQKDMCHYREAPMSPSSLYQAASLPEHIQSKPCIQSFADDQANQSCDSCLEEAIQTKKRGSLAEAALEVPAAVEEPGLAPKKCKETSLDRGSSSLLSKTFTEPYSDSNQPSRLMKAPLNTPPLPSQSALPAAAEVNHVSLTMLNSFTVVEQQVSVQRIAQPPVSRLGEEHALFARIKSMLDRSPQDFLESSQSILVTPEQINQAKHLLLPFYSMKFEQLAHHSQRDQLESSIELLLEAGHFPPCVLDIIRCFHKSFVRNIERHSICRESINRFAKNKKESEVHKDELAKKHSRFDHIVKQIAVETEEIEKLTKELKKKRKSVLLKEAEAKDIAASSTSSANALTRCTLRSKNLEKEKQIAEKDKAEIEDIWEEFKRETRKYM